jgi:hypothetical protein
MWPGCPQIIHPPAFTSFMQELQAYSSHCQNIIAFLLKINVAISVETLTCENLPFFHLCFLLI